uniref:Uncharacterized protein n=1 Tax=Avena sativa TaxID=4498 RepID=A0ACD5UEX9_AVESA
MKTSVMVLACLLLLQLLATTAHGIRLDRQLHEALSSSKKELAGDSKAGAPPDAVDHSSSRRCTPDGNCSGTTTEQMTPIDAAAVVAEDIEPKVAVSAYARPVPKFHEDYYGAGGHERNHH